MKKKWRARVTALLLCAAMTITAFPVQAADMGMQTQDEQTPDPVQQRQESIDWTNRADDLKLELTKVIYQEAGEEKAIEASAGRIDMSSINLSDESRLRLQFSYQLLRERNEAEEQIQAGDTFGIDLGGTPFICADQELSESIQNGAGETEAVFNSKENKITVTFQVPEETAVSGAEFQVEAAVNREELKAEPSEAGLILQSPQGAEAVQAVFLLPAAKSADIESDSQSKDTASPEAGKEENALSDDKAAAVIQPKTSDSKPEGGESNTDGIESKTKETESITEGMESKSESTDSKARDTESNEAGVVAGTDSKSDADKPWNILKSFRSLFSGSVRSSDSVTSGLGKAVRTKHTYPKSELPEGFEEIQLTVSSKEGGYMSSEDNPLVNLAYKVFMDESVLYARSEEMTMDSTFPIDKGDTAKWLQSVQEWLKAHPEYTDIAYTFDMGKYFKVSGQELSLPITMEQNQMDIGSYGIKDGELKITMNPICCFMDNVFFEFSVDAQIDQKQLEHDPLEVVVDDKGGLVFQSSGKAGGGGGDTEDPKYTVVKEAPAKVTGTSIEYKITVEAKEGERLNGLTLKDAVPAGLSVESAKAVTGGKGEPISFNGAEYTFAAYNAEVPDSEITSGEITFVMGLDEASYKEFIKNGINQSFKNKASLYGKDPGKPLAESEEVSTRMTARFIQKTGKAQNLEGTKYGWTINLQTHLPSMEYGYLVDTLCWTDHQYDFENGIQVQMDGQSYTINKFVNISESYSTVWNDLTAEGIIGAAGIENEFNTDAPTAYYYLIDETDDSGNKIDNPFFGLNKDSLNAEESEYQQRAILIIPYKNLQGTSEPKAVTIKYTTNLNMHGLEASEGALSNPQRYWELMQEKSYSPVIDNEVNLLWHNTGGVGPGPAQQGSVNFGKEVETSPGAISKKGIRYDEKTQMLTWSVDVNKFGVDMGNVVLTDILVNDIYAIPVPEEEFEVKWYQYSHNTQELKDSGVFTTAGGKCVITSGTAGGRDVKNLAVKLGDVKADDMYTLTFTVQLTDKALLRQQSQNMSASNSLKIDYLLEGEPKNYTVEGTMRIKNTLIEKEAVGSYNNDTYELPWKVTINPNSLSIKDAQFADTLESGFTFGEVKGVEYGGSESDDYLKLFKEHIGKPGFDKENPVLPIGDIDKPMVIYFTTVATDEWRNTKLKAGETNGAVKTVEVENLASLQGKIDGIEEIRDARDTANHVIPINPIGKSGIYNKEDGTIAWTLELNQEHLNLAGLTLSEVLTAEDDLAAPVHELDVDSVEIVKLVRGKDGTVNEKEAVDSEAKISKISQDGFYCTFGGTDNYASYRIRFTTCLTGDAFGQTIQNKVYLKDSSDNVSNSSGTSDGGYDGSFEMDKDSNAQVRPSVSVRKVSSNSEGEKNKKDSLGLNQAQFGLEAHEFEYNSVDGVLKIKDEVVQYGKARYTQDGEIYFTNIKTSTAPDGKNNLICVIQETEAPAGYVKNEAPQFVYFSTGSGNMIDDKIQKAEYEGKSYTELSGVYHHKTIDDNGTAPLASVAFRDEPVVSSFEFTKQEVNLAAYQDKEGTITSEYKAAGEVQFKLEPVGNLAGHVKSYDLKTEADGTVKISNLDAGTYLLKEVGPNAGMKAGSVKLNVTWNSDQKRYDYAFVKKSESGGLKISSTDSTILLNDLNTAEINFSKYVDYTDGSKESTVQDNRQPLEGIHFRIISTDPAAHTAANTSRNPAKKLTAKSVGVTAGNISKTSKSNASGKVSFSGLPVGSYNIFEVYGDGAGNKNIPGYVTKGQEELVYTLSVTESTAGADGTKKLTSELIPRRSGQTDAGAEADTEKICYNRPVKGTIAFEKRIAEDTLSALNGVTLAGAEFGLFRKIGGKTAASPVYEAKSNEQGSVKFTDVEYGDYVLKETTVPAGYIAMKPIEILRSQLAVQADTFTYAKTADDSNALTAAAANHLYKTSLELLKLDADDVPMSGINFTVYRRGESAVDSLGNAVNSQSSTDSNTPMTLDVDSQVNTYYRYMPSAVPAGNENNGILTTDVSGKINIGNLPYGDYLLTEDTTGLNLQDNGSLVAVLIHIARDTGGSYTASVVMNEEANITHDTVSDFYTLTDSSEAKGWSKCLVNAAGSYIITNHKKFGFVNLKKIAADEKGNVKPDAKALAGVEFSIYKVTGSDTKELYLTLKTDSEGQLLPDKDGAYRDVNGKSRHLWYGEYIIQETENLDGYCKNTNEISFTIGEGRIDSVDLAGHEGTAWIYSDNSTSGAVYIAKGRELPENKYFVNKLVTLEIYKTDDNGENPQPLVLTEFKLKPQAQGDRFVNGKAQLELMTDKSGKCSVSGQLIAGHTYKLTETKAADGYVTPANADMVFKVSDDGKTIQIDSTANALNARPYGNSGLHIQNAAVKLSVQKNDDKNQGLAGAELELYHWDTVKGEKQGLAVKAWTSEEKAADFEGAIAEGTYVLAETRRPSGYFMADAIYFKLEAGNQLTLIPGPDGKVRGKLDGTTIVMTDEKILRDITLKKTYAKENGGSIANVAFDLYDMNKTDGNNLAAAGYTDAGGNLTFQDIPEGKYLLKENLQESIKAGAADDVYMDEAWSMGIEVLADSTQKAVIMKVDGKEHSGNIEITNDVFAAGLSLQKLDPEDDTHLEGVDFLLEKKTGDDFKPYKKAGVDDGLRGGSADTAGVDTFSNSGIYTTDADGLHISGLEKGDYRITEVRTIYGYVLDAKTAFSAEFTLDNDCQGKELAITKTASDEKGWDLEVISGKELLTDKGLTNERAAGSVTLKKVAKLENGGGNKESTGLDGVVYTLFKKNDSGWLSNMWDFITGNQYDSVRDVTGEELAEEGLLTINGLEWGQYKLIEKTPQAGYILDTAEYEFTIGRVDMDIILSVDKGEIVNVPNEVTLEKRGSDLLPGSGDEDLLDGSVFTLTNEKNEKDTHTVAVDEGRVTLTGLLTGGETYVLHEVAAPAGYALNPVSEDVHLTMGTDGQISIDGTPVPGNILTIVDHPTRFTFTKMGKYNEDCADAELGSVDSGALKVLGGAEFTAYAVNAPQTAAAAAVSEPNGTVTFEKLPLGKYYIKETQTPDKYRPDDHTYLAEVVSGDFEGLRDSKENLLEDNIIVNDVYRADIRFMKVNEKNPDEVLEGSQYGLYRKQNAAAETIVQRKSIQKPGMMPGEDGNAGEWQLIATAVTDADGILEFKGVLMDTEYMVRELKAPDGSYVSANPMIVAFTRDDEGQISMSKFDDGSGTAAVDPDTGEIVWYEPPVEVSFSKQNLDGEPLAGAALQLQDSTGAVVEEWISDAEPHISSGVLVIGESYKLVETKAPAGYRLAEPVSFTVSDETVGAGENKVLSVVMKDAPVILKVTKHDRDSGASLVGAAFELTGSFADGSKSVELKPGTGNDTLTAMLAAGNSYEITETKAPEGYVKLETPIRFTVDDKGNIKLSENSENTSAALTEENGRYILSISNEKITNPPNPDENGNGTDTGKDTKPDTKPDAKPDTKPDAKPAAETVKSADAGAKTGDDTPVWPLTAVCIAFLGIAVGCGQRKRKSRK